MNDQAKAFLKLSDTVPPGPRSPALLQTLEWMRRPTTVLTRYADRYGTPFTLRRVGSPPMVVVSDPADVEAVFLGSSDCFAPSTLLFNAGTVLTLDGEEHQRHRRLIMPAFHGDRLAEQADVIRDVTRRHTDTWGERVGIVDAMIRITCETIFRVLFGIERAHELDELSRALDTILAQISSPVMYLPLARVNLGGFNGWGRYLTAREVFDRLLSQEIVRAREQLDVRRDVLAHIIREGIRRGDPLTDDEIRDEMLTLLLAGHITTSAALGSVFQWILGNSSIRDRVVAEVRDSPHSAAEVAESKWLEACILESLRLSPPFALTHRYLSQATPIGDYLLPEGAYVRPSPFLTHRRPDIFPDPTRYDPCRFLGDRPGSFEFYPFGGGLRTCLGMSFALLQMKIVVATVIDRLDLDLEAEPTLKVRRIGPVTAPAHGTPVRITRRLASPPHRGAA